MHKQNKDCRKQDKFKTGYMDCRAGPECQNLSVEIALRIALKYDPLNLLMWNFFCCYFTKKWFCFRKVGTEKTLFCGWLSGWMDGWMRVSRSWLKVLLALSND